MALAGDRNAFRSWQDGWLRLVMCIWIVGIAPAAFAQQPSVPPSADRPRDMDVLKTKGGLASLPSPVWVQKRPILLDVHFAVPRDLSRGDAPFDRGRIRTRETPAGDPGVAFTAGDAIITGTAEETWPIVRATFETTYAPLAGGRMGQDGKFYKKPAAVLGVQMKESFTVTASWGRLQGKPDDWLIQYDEAGTDFGIVGQELFEQTYERLQVTPDLQARLASMRAHMQKNN